MKVCGYWFWELVGSIVELVGRKGQVSHLARIDHMNTHRVLEEVSAVEKMDLELKQIILPESLVRTEMDGLIIVVIKFFQEVRQFGILLLVIFFGGEGPSTLPQTIKRKSRLGLFGGSRRVFSGARTQQNSETEQRSPLANHS